jgi:hypothetical protein
MESRPLLFYGWDQLKQTKTNPKSSEITNEKIKYSHPYHVSPLELHGYHRVGNQPPLPQMRRKRR